MTAALPPSNQWTPSADYLDRAETVLKRLGCDSQRGISSVEARARLERDGSNTLGKTKSTTPLQLLVEQFTSSVVGLLIVAAIISALLHEYLQTAGITAAIFINAGIGFLTEYQARISLKKLASLSGSVVRVLRDGTQHNLPTADLVRGDIVLLEPGNRVPADLRLISTAPVSVDESILTGESVSVDKSCESDDQADLSILYQGTTISSGRATALVVATGQQTRLGKLSITLVELDSTSTPLQKQLETLGKHLTKLTIVLCVVFAVIGIFRGLSPLLMMETSIALAVAAIPESLPVVATLALALGIQQMVQHKVLVRRLPAVEALGSASIICTDKTGTLTQNRMVTTELIGCFERYEIVGTGYSPMGDISNELDRTTPVNRLHVQEILLPALLANDARLENHGEGWHIHGDPTDGALLVAGAKLELDQKTLFRTYKRIAELPFDLHRKRISTLHETPGSGLKVCCKGSPESILSVCTSVQIGNDIVPLTDEHINWFGTENKRMAEAGLRVLGFATKLIDESPACLDEASLETDLVLTGLAGMYDPAKEGVVEAVAECKAAGIRVMMLTGDQARTAFAIAKKLNISQSETDLLSGDEISSMSSEELNKRLANASVFARVTPELKLSIVQKLQQLGEVVAMTGDGVNDAPALKQADIGVCMGIAGSDLARDASSLIITDDNFATIVKAISQGRQIYNKIRCAICYLLTASVTSLAITCAGIFFYKGLVLTALQLLWLNLIMHVFPALGLVGQQNWDDLMNSPPRSPQEQLLTKQLMKEIGTRAGVVTTISLLAALMDQIVTGGKTITSAVLTASSLALVFQSWTWLATSIEPVTSSNLRQFKPMLVGTAISLGLIVTAISVPTLEEVLETQPLPAMEICGIVLMCLFAYLPFARHAKPASTSIPK